MAPAAVAARRKSAYASKGMASPVKARPLGHFVASHPEGS